MMNYCKHMDVNPRLGKVFLPTRMGRGGVVATPPSAIRYFW